MRWFIQHQPTIIIILRALLRAQQHRADDSHICFKLKFYTGSSKASLKHNPLPCLARETLITTYSNFYVHQISSVILLCTTDSSGLKFRKFSNLFISTFCVLFFGFFIFGFCSINFYLSFYVILHV